MDFKKITRNPIIYVLLVGLLLVIGFSLISNLSGARQISTKEGLDLLKGGTVTQVVTNDPDQRVDLTLSQPFEGANDVQFYYSQARANEVASAIDSAAPADGFNDIVPKPSWFDSILGLMIPLVLLGLLFWWLLSSAQGGGSKVMQFGKSCSKLVTQ